MQRSEVAQAHWSALQLLCRAGPAPPGSHCATASSLPSAQSASPSQTQPGSIHSAPLLQAKVSGPHFPLRPTFNSIAEPSAAVKLNCCNVCPADLLLASLLVLAALAVPLPIAAPPQTDALPPRAALQLLPL